MWIGLTNTGENGNWTWTDGSPYNYTAWMKDPTPARLDLCAYTTNKDIQWKTKKCDTEMMAMCKKNM